MRYGRALIRYIDPGGRSDCSAAVTNAPIVLSLFAEEMEADADEIEAETAASAPALAAEDVPLSAEEQGLLKLLGDCTHAWNVLDKKTHALKLGRQALERIKGATGIRPRMVAEVRQWGNVSGVEAGLQGCGLVSSMRRDCVDRSSPMLQGVLVMHRSGPMLTSP